MGPSERAASQPSSVSRFLRRSSVATVSRYGPPRSRDGPSERNEGPIGGMRDADPLSRDSEQLHDLAGRELGVDDDQVARPRRVRVLPRVHPVGLRMHPGRVAEREEVVDRRRADASPLRWVHPVGEVEDVQRAHEPLDRASTRTGSTRFASSATSGERATSRCSIGKPVELLLDPALSGRCDRRERDDLVGAVGLRQPSQHPDDVVADAGPWQREWRDVDDDPQVYSPSGSGRVSGCEP